MKKSISDVPFLRWLLVLVGAAASTAPLDASAAGDRIFARQFIGKGTKVGVPNMTYDPVQQLMVDPHTRRPIYDNPRRLQLALPTITSGCDTCPKKDDDGSDYTS